MIIETGEIRCREWEWRQRFATQWQNATHPPPDSGVGRWDQLRGGELFLSCKILLPNVLRQKSSPPSPWRGTRLGGQLPSACHGNHQSVAKPVKRQNEFIRLAAWRLPRAPGNGLRGRGFAVCGLRRGRPRRSA